MIRYVMARLDGSAAHERRVGMAAAKKLSSGTECVASLDYDVFRRRPTRCGRHKATTNWPRR